jgi:lycopene cyclase domain-containing protein
MTYASILSVLIIPPLLLMITLVVIDSQRAHHQRKIGEPLIAVFLHMLLALVYTTPWDNYLVANRVWWYDPALVTGITLAWVPLEEYTFFLLQTALTGFWLLWIRGRINSNPLNPNLNLRRWLSLVGILLWLSTIAVLIMSSPNYTYLALISIWAIPPLLLQLAFGADILSANRRVLLLGILPPTLYLWVVDFLAIRWETWTISPSLTTGWKVGLLPVEEMLFFLATNIMVVFGITLLLSPQSRQRWQNWQAQLKFHNKDPKELTPPW